jgi:mannosyltransferase OCH1-like enzyme
MPYISVMYSTGPLFLSVIWKEYIGETRPMDQHVRILMPGEYKGHKWSFFNIVKGSSWHGKDAQTIFWMGKHWIMITLAGFAIAGVIGGFLWWCWSMWIMRVGKPIKGGKKFPVWRRLSGEKRRELIDRMA